MLAKIDLSGWWQIVFDEQDVGRQAGWGQSPPPRGAPVYLPSNWNTVFPDRHTYDGAAWYSRGLYLGPELGKGRTVLRFAGVNYHCQAFLNGGLLGEHEGGFTPFAFDVTPAGGASPLRPGEVNRLVLRVDGLHDEWTLPPRGVDWFNYNGVYRPLYLERTGLAFIADYTLRTFMDGRVSLQAELGNAGAAGDFRLVVEIADAAGRPVAGKTLPVELPPAGGSPQPVTCAFILPDPVLWGPDSPYLYTLRLQLTSVDGEIADRRAQRFGLREVAVDGHHILLNGREIRLVGVSKHDEYPYAGRTVTRAQLLHDYELLRRTNANFVRLCHYPHSRLEHEVLDELGLIAMSEVPLIFLHQAQMADENLLAKAERMLTEAIQAEKNVTSILFWGLFTECDTHLDSSRFFVRRIVERARALDDSRILLMASIRPLEDVTYEDFDVIGVNYWEGWYRDAPLSQAEDWLQTLTARFPNKPLLITSHGWEGMYGERSPERRVRWSEDGQAAYLGAIAELFMGHANLAGEIVWTFADFKVSDWEDSAHPTLHRKRYLERPMQTNHKGLVDFYRRPKLAYYTLQEKFACWRELAAAGYAPEAETRSRSSGTGEYAPQVHILSDAALLGHAAAAQFIRIIQTRLARQDHVRVAFAAAASQEAFLAGLVRNRHLLDWERVHAFHLDEYLGTAAATSAGFANWLKERLIDHLPFGGFEALDGLSADPQAECARYAEGLAAAQLDLVCLGIGENGHLAFNDPPADFSDPCPVKVVELDETCRLQQVRDGAFPALADVPRRALTLSVPTILNARELLCVVPGLQKAQAVYRALREPVSGACPASALRLHPQVSLYLDRTSAALLK